jgi:hypothetical protein
MNLILPADGEEISMKHDVGRASISGAYRARLSGVWALSALVTLGTAHGFQPLITDDTGTQGTGGNQLEGSFTRTNDRVATGDTVTREWVAVYTRGVSDTVDLFLGLPHRHISPGAAPAESGWSNAALGAKWRFYDDDKSKLSFAFRPELQLAVSGDKEARGLGQGRTSGRFDLLMSQETGFGAVHANLAYTQVNFEDDALNAATRRSQFRLSLAPVWDVTEHWKLALDVGIMTNPDRTQQQRMGYVEIGTSVSPNKTVDFALGIIRNYNTGQVSTTQATAGVTLHF